MKKMLLIKGKKFVTPPKANSISWRSLVLIYVFGFRGGRSCVQWIIFDCGDSYRGGSFYELRWIEHYSTRGSVV